MGVHVRVHKYMQSATLMFDRSTGTSDSRPGLVSVSQYSTCRSSVHVNKNILETNTKLQANSNSFPTNSQAHDLFIYLWCIKEQTHK